MATYTLQADKRRPHYYRGYELIPAVGGRWIVLAAGLQLGGRIDASGAGDATFDSLETARAYVRELGNR